MPSPPSTSTVLDAIVAGVLRDLSERAAAVPLSEIRSRAVAAAAPLDPLPGLGDGLRVIAEVKRRSPSRGDLADIDQPGELARAYAAGGAVAVSVLTERSRFGGSLDDLDAVRDAVAIPILRKDFLVTDYQIWESRAHGADLVLLMASALGDADLVRLYDLAVSLGMTPLVEVHDADEVARLARLGARLVGVNARDLKTLAVDPGVFARLRPLLPPGVFAVAESGIRGLGDARRYADEGADAVLVGEALVTSGSPREAVAEMTGVAVTR